MIARFLFAAAHALFWAATDARDIRNGKNINHPVRWALRAAIEVGASIVFAYIRDEPIGIRLVLVTITAAFLFSALFRFLLNTMRGADWRYVSWSSLYDTLFLKLVGAPLYIGAGEYFLRKYRAGTLAYIFEAVVFAELAYLSAVL